MPSCCNDVDALVARYSRLYELGDASVVREVERSVLGCEYGGTSWTTRDEAQRIIGLLDLSASDRLLDVGAGSGWPALYVLQCSACEAVLVDLPLSAMRAALDRALEDRLADRCRVSVADAASLPFRDACFDAVSHSDVLCCMPGKRAMLRECRRVARRHARMVFSMIALTPSLSAEDREMALASGPAFVDAPADYSLMLEEAGWRTRERYDVTPEFERCVRKSLVAMEKRASDFIPIMGQTDFDDRLQQRRATLGALARGLLKRELLAAVTSD